MPLINSAIPPLSCEVIQDKIALILADELPNQATLAGNPAIDATVVKDRLTTPGHQEFPLVSVMFNRVSYGSRSQVHSVGDNIITILIYTSGAATTDKEGGEISLANNRAIARVIRGVLEAPAYKRLGFTTNFIQRLNIESYTVVQPDQDQSSVFIALGQIDLSVEAVDSNVLQAARELEGLDTVTKIDETEKGQKITIN